MNARLTRISTNRLMASAGSVVVGAFALLVTSGIAFANDPIEAGMDLPIEAPVYKKPQPPKAPEPVQDTTTIDTTVPPRFFGNDLVSASSIIYVIDQSGSMSLSVASFTNDKGVTVSGGNRLDRAKSELLKSIQSLPKSFVFNVIFYDECVRTWKPGTVAADDANKSAAASWVASQQPMGFTNTGLAVATALGDKNNKSVVVLSDGEPNFLDCSANYIGSYDEHKSLIRQANSQGSRIDCFGIGVTGNPDARKFMQDVASANNGTYTEVN